MSELAGLGCLGLAYREGFCALPPSPVTPKLALAKAGGGGWAGLAAQGWWVGPRELAMKNA